MTIVIDQKFLRCDVCGKMLPIGASPIKLEAEGKDLKVCSEWCLEYYNKYYREKK